jgi:hypothetical protein
MHHHLQAVVIFLGIYFDIAEEPQKIEPFKVIADYILLIGAADTGLHLGNNDIGADGFVPFHLYGGNVLHRLGGFRGSNGTLFRRPLRIFFGKSRNGESEKEKGCKE